MSEDKKEMTLDEALDLAYQIQHQFPKNWPQHEAMSKMREVIEKAVECRDHCASMEQYEKKLRAEKEKLEKEIAALKQQQ